MGQARTARVPVEHRIVGLDRRTLPFALAAVAVWLLWTVVLPWVDGRIGWEDTIRAGERVRLADDVTFAPAPGWGLQSGLRTTDTTSSGATSTKQVEVTNDGVIFGVQRGTWTGTPRALLDQITKITSTEAGRDGFHLSTRPTSIQTASGGDGVLEGFKTPRSEGLIAAFVFGDTGLQVQVVGAPAQLLMMGLAPVVIRTVSDGLIVGAYVGLGFQILEDIFYAQNSAFEQFGAHQSEAVLGTFALRAVTGIPSHALYTALFGAGLIYAIGTRAQPRRLGRGIALMLAAMVLHGVWDSAAAIGGPWFAVPVLFATMVFCLVALVVAIRWAGGRERDFMRDIMTPEVANGTITAAELDALTGHGKDKRAAVKTRPEGVSRRREKHVLRAARDLAEDLAASDGADSPEVEHSRAEISRLRAH